MGICSVVWWPQAGQVMVDSRIMRSGSHARGLAFSRRCTDGAGGFFGIARMSKGRMILAGGEGVLVVMTGSNSKSGIEQRSDHPKAI